MQACASGRLDEVDVAWARQVCLTVVLCSEGYPGSYPKGREISGVEEAGREPGVVVFHAGTRREGGRLLTAGGRVLNVTALGTDIPSARERAYAAASRIRFQGMQYRKDIAGGA
jgi:phosphoribosylamine--glycine ligase